MQEQLEAITQALNNREGYWAELGDDHYLIRFGKTGDDGGNSLVLMYDLGVTWEPCRAYTTPQYCTISIEDTQKAVQNLAKLADSDLPTQCGDGEFQHLIEG